MCARQNAAYMRTVTSSVATHRSFTSTGRRPGVTCWSGTRAKRSVRPRVSTSTACEVAFAAVLCGVFVRPVSPAGAGGWVGVPPVRPVSGFRVVPVAGVVGLSRPELAPAYGSTGVTLTGGAASVTPCGSVVGRGGFAGCSFGFQGSASGISVVATGGRSVAGAFSVTGVTSGLGGVLQ